MRLSFLEEARFGAVPSSSQSPGWDDQLGGQDEPPPPSLGQDAHKRYLHPDPHKWHSSNQMSPQGVQASVTELGLAITTYIVRLGHCEAPRPPSPPPPWRPRGRAGGGNNGLRHQDPSPSRSRPPSVETLARAHNLPCRWDGQLPRVDLPFPEPRRDLPVSAGGSPCILEPDHPFAHAAQISLFRSLAHASSLHEIPFFQSLTQCVATPVYLDMAMGTHIVPRENRFSAHPWLAGT